MTTGRKKKQRGSTSRDRLMPLNREHRLAQDQRPPGVAPELTVTKSTEIHVENVVAITRQMPQDRMARVFDLD